MTKVAETTGLPPRLMSSLTQALFKQTSPCSKESWGNWNTKRSRWLGALTMFLEERCRERPLVPFWGFKSPAHLLQERRMWCGPIKMHLPQQRPQGAISYLYCMGSLCLTSHPTSPVIVIRRDQHLVFLGAFFLSRSLNIWKLSLPWSLRNPYSMAKVSLQKWA